jgi:hypothetical protein
LVVEIDQVYIQSRRSYALPITVVWRTPLPGIKTPKRIRLGANAPGTPRLLKGHGKSIKG